MLSAISDNHLPQISNKPESTTNDGSSSPTSSKLVVFTKSPTSKLKPEAILQQLDKGQATKLVTKWMNYSNRRSTIKGGKAVQTPRTRKTKRAKTNAKSKKASSSAKSKPVNKTNKVPQTPIKVTVTKSEPEFSKSGIKNNKAPQTPIKSNVYSGQSSPGSGIKLRLSPKRFDAAMKDIAQKSVMQANTVPVATKPSASNPKKLINEKIESRIKAVAEMFNSKPLQTETTVKLVQADQTNSCDRREASQF